MLLENLKNAKMKPYFDRTEFSHEGEEWLFPQLLHMFVNFVEKENMTANALMDRLFDIFDFFSVPEVLVHNIIGYDRLKACIEECPSIFKEILIQKMIEFIELNKTIDIGLNSYHYLTDEMQPIHPQYKKYQ